MVTRVVLGLVTLMSGPAMAQLTGDAIFLQGDACYRRAYTTAHLAAHPVQRVAAISLSPEEDFGTDNVLALRITIALREQSQPYTGVAYCMDAGKDLTCAVEGDGGGFTLTLRDDGLLLTVGREGIGLEGARDFLSISGTGGDDRAFLLRRTATRRCP
jgi:hypothetical protein